MKKVVNIEEGKVRILGTEDHNGVFNKYVVVKGDTLGEIAEKYGTTVQYLAKVNEIPNVDLIEIDQVLYIPENPSVETKAEPGAGKKIIIGQGKIRIIGNEELDGVYEAYTVVKGDTLGKIAKEFETTVEKLAKVNNIENVDLIEIDQVVYVPSKQFKFLSKTKMIKSKFV